MIARLLVLLVAAGTASTALAQSAEQLENALGGSTYRCNYDGNTDPNNVTGGHTVVRLGADGNATISAPNAPNAQDRSELTGQWWADGGMTVCWDVGNGAQCGIADPQAPRELTMMSPHGQVPCAAQ